MSKNKLESLPSQDFIIGKKDEQQAMGSNELLPCPFCGSWAFSIGEKKASGNVVYEVICTNTPDCGATVHSCMKDESKARSRAIAKWNKRKAIQ